MDSTHTFPAAPAVAYTTPAAPKTAAGDHKGDQPALNALSAQAKAAGVVDTPVVPKEAQELEDEAGAEEEDASFAAYRSAGDHYCFQRPPPCRPSAGRLFT